jgi:hypothetical protein
VYLISCTRNNARKLYRSLEDRFPNHQFNITPNLGGDPELVEIHAERIDENAFGAGRDGMLMQGFVEGFIAAHK